MADLTQFFPTPAAPVGGSVAALIQQPQQVWVPPPLAAPGPLTPTPQQDFTGTTANVAAARQVVAESGSTGPMRARIQAGLPAVQSVAQEYSPPLPDLRGATHGERMAFVFGHSHNIPPEHPANDLVAETALRGEREAVRRGGGAAGMHGQQPAKSLMPDEVYLPYFKGLPLDVAVRLHSLRLQHAGVPAAERKVVDNINQQTVAEHMNNQAIFDESAKTPQDEAMLHKRQGELIDRQSLALTNFAERMKSPQAAVFAQAARARANAPGQSLNPSPVPYLPKASEGDAEEH